MNTLTLLEAASFLKLHPEELRSRAKRGLVPAAKVGRRWVFLEPDFTEYVRSLYPLQRQALRVTTEKEVICHYVDAAVSGGSTSRPPRANVT